MGIVEKSLRRGLLSEEVFVVVTAACAAAGGGFSAAGCGWFGADVDCLFHSAWLFQQIAAVSAELRGQPQRVGAFVQAGGEDEGDGRGFVDDPEVGGDGRLGAVFADENEAHGGVRAGDAQVLAAEGEGASGGGGGVGGLGGDVFHAADADGGRLDAYDVDGGVLDGLAQVGADVEVDHDLVFVGVPGGVLDQSAEGDGGVVEAGVDVIAGHEQAFDDALLQFEDVEDGFGSEAAVFGFHFGQDAVLVGGAQADGHGVDVLGVVLGQGVVLQLGVDLIFDVFCHNG